MKKAAYFIAVVLVVVLIVSCSYVKKPEHDIEFIDKACIKPVAEYDYHICSPLKLKVDHNPVTIPNGFITDLASIPKPLWWLLSPSYSGFVYPAIVHDYMYRCPNHHTRYYADNVFYSALLKEGVSQYVAQRMYFAVRAFGGSHFQNENDCHYMDAKQINALVKVDNITMKS